MAKLKLFDTKNTTSNVRTRHSHMNLISCNIVVIYVGEKLEFLSEIEADLIRKLKYKE